jgi:hypothetical protein
MVSAGSTGGFALRFRPVSGTQVVHSRLCGASLAASGRPILVTADCFLTGPSNARGIRPICAAVVLERGCTEAQSMALVG